jgi:hypothetical protein
MLHFQFHGQGPRGATIAEARTGDRMVTCQDHGS